MASEGSSIDILVADDHDLVRTAIKALLEATPGVRVVAEARDGEELLAALASLPRVDLVITDLAMPKMDGFAAIKRMRETHPALKILVVSSSDTAEPVQQAVANGANGYVPKGASAEELATALRHVMVGGTYFGSPVARLLLQPRPPGPRDMLTERQVEILTMMARGLSAKEIGFELGLSSKTVDVHRARIMERLDLHDVASLTRYALRNRLVEP